MFTALQQKLFINWMRQTNQIFTGNEYTKRLSIWASNSNYVNNFNLCHNFKLSLNQFAAFTSIEYRSLLGVIPQLNSISSSFETKIQFDPPESIDWRQYGCVTSIKDQGMCGACWAFSAIQSAEGIWALAGNKLISLSEQNLLDCVTDCFGCNGGNMIPSFQYVINRQDGHFMRETDYPYVGQMNTCSYNSALAVVSITSVNSVPRDEKSLMAAVSSKGPIAAAVDASHYSFQLYSSGIYDEPSCSSTYIDHGVGVVGYGSEGQSDYWIVKNSWGSSWGENGYIRMSRNKNNQCGIATLACYPTV